MSVEFCQVKSPSLPTPPTVFQNITAETKNNVQKKKSINTYQEPMGYMTKMYLSPMLKKPTQADRDLPLDRAYKASWTLFSRTFFIGLDTFRGFHAKALTKACLPILLPRIIGSL